MIKKSLKKGCQPIQFFFFFSYAYNLQWFSRFANKGSMPQQMLKLIDYCKGNNLEVFNPNEGYVCVGLVYQANGIKFKKNWNNLPLPPHLWRALCEPANIQHLEEKIEKFNQNTDLKLAGVPNGAKMDMSVSIGHLNTGDERVQASNYYAFTLLFV